MTGRGDAAVAPEAMLECLSRRDSKLAILRPDNLGDLILFSGTLKHLRARWPKTGIALCVRSYGAELFARCPHIDEIISYDEMWKEFDGEGRVRWMPAVRGSDRLGGWLRRHAPRLAFPGYHCDVACLPLVSPLPEYHEVVRLIPSRFRLGIKGNTNNQSPKADAAAEAYYTARMDVSQGPANRPEAEYTRQWLRFLGIDASPDALWPEFWTSREDARRAEELLPPVSGALRLAIAPGVTSLAGKNLPASWFAEAVGGMEWRNLHIVIFGGPGETSTCSAVADALRSVPGVATILNLAGKTGVRDLVECMKRCDVFLSQETASLHIATALRKPVVGIMGGGHFGRFYPWGDPSLSRVVQREMSCYGCNWKCIYDSVRCIQEIPPAVAASELRSLAEAASRRIAAASIP